MGGNKELTEPNDQVISITKINEQGRANVQVSYLRTKKEEKKKVTFEEEDYSAINKELKIMIEEQSKELVDLKQEYREQGYHFVKLQEELQNVETNLALQIKAKDEQINSLNKKLASAENSYTTEVEHSEKKLISRKELVNKFQILKDEKVTLNVEINRLKEETYRLEKRQLAYIKDAERMNERFENMSKKIKDYEEQNIRIKASEKNKDKEIEKLNTEIEIESNTNKTQGRLQNFTNKEREDNAKLFTNQKEAYEKEISALEAKHKLERTKLIRENQLKLEKLRKMPAKELQENDTLSMWLKLRKKRKK
jgi:hypothetical protein